MAAILTIVAEYEASCRTIELLASFLDNTVQALSSLLAISHVILNVHSSLEPPRHHLYDLMVRQLVERLTFVQAALFADDPQLAMSVLPN